MGNYECRERARHDKLGCYLPGKVICLPDPKIQEYPVLPGKMIFTVFLPGKNSKSKLILRQSFFTVTAPDPVKY